MVLIVWVFTHRHNRQTAQKHMRGQASFHIQRNLFRGTLCTGDFLETGSEPISAELQKPLRRKVQEWQKGCTYPGSGIC
jgi:hypothetical protein